MPLGRLCTNSPTFACIWNGHHFAIIRFKCKPVDLKAVAVWIDRCGDWLLPLLGVLGLGGLLGGAPPGLVVAVPGNRLRQALREVGVGRLPAQLAAELGGVDGVAAVVARAVAHPVEGVVRLPHRAQDVTHHGDVVPLAVGADEVGLAGDAPGEHRPHGARVVLGVDPVADVAPVAVELGADAGKDVGDLQIARSK